MGETKQDTRRTETCKRCGEQFDPTGPFHIVSEGSGGPRCNTPPLANYDPAAVGELVEAAEEIGATADQLLTIMDSRDHDTPPGPGYLLDGPARVAHGTRLTRLRAALAAVKGAVGCPQDHDR